MKRCEAALRWVVLVFFAGMSIGLGGCASTQEAMKAKPSEGAGFVPVEQMTKREDLPFQKVWANPEVNWDQYKAIYIADVNTDYLIEANWWQKGLRREQMDQDVQQIAQYMRDKFKEAFRNDPNQRFVVLDVPERGSLTIQMALTELVPSKVVMEALGFAPYGIGMGTKMIKKASGGNSTVAFESRIVDTTSGEVVAMAADREEQKINPVDVKGLTWYAPAKSIIDEWADQFVRIANRKQGEVIEDSSPFSLKPW